MYGESLLAAFEKEVYETTGAVAEALRPVEADVDPLNLTIKLLGETVPIGTWYPVTVKLPDVRYAGTVMIRAATQEEAMVRARDVFPGAEITVSRP